MNSPLILDQATDWTRQTNEERFISSAETLFVFGWIDDRTRARIVDGVRDQATAWRERQAARGVHLSTRRTDPYRR